ncbi:guanylate kinase [Streptomyces sp. HB2AG]|uniref:guanylate kinase n=1 Tax=Streptomyces sp. HB2AG TaxID=2983400 RepID=UPI0022AA5A94|nr:guanylate kinase [Streptomyces sp. HB2AG]MCZ2526208.1 guanylate kinase [Streptomyces sp. HB2AG]
MSAVVLYGPPTAGKDTVTAALRAADRRFRLVTKLKQGTGRSTGYRFVTADELDALRQQGRIVVETRRYGNVYAVDRDSLEDPQAQGMVPVVHIGNVADLRTLLGRAPTAWLRVLLWVPREVCAVRSRQRGDVDTPKRLTAWDETVQDLLRSDLQGLFDLVVRTDRVDTGTAAKEITTALDGPVRPLPPEELRAALALAPPEPPGA